MIYFDNSATTFFKPPEVINAVNTAMRFLSANPGRGGHSMSTKAGQLVYKTREHMADYIGLKNIERIIFTANCTAALNMAILGTVKVGGHVITTAYEHNSVIRPLFELERAGKISLRILCPNRFGIVDEEMIRSAITPETYLIITNHISNVTGAITPIKSIGKLAREKNILYAVDGAQSIGYADISMPCYNVDMLSIAPHKGLHAIQGVGVLALSDRVSIKPIIYGGTGTESANVYQPLDLPESLESGTLPTPAIAGLNAALFWSEKNRSFMVEKIAELSHYLVDALIKTDNIQIYNSRNSLNGIVAFNVGTLTSVETCEILSNQYDMCLRGGLHCAPLIHKHLSTLDRGIVRVSLGIDNTYAEVNFLINAIREIAKSK